MVLPSYSELNKVLVPLAVEAGTVIHSMFGNYLNVSRKKDMSPVTKADQAGEEIILAGIGAEWPDIDIIAEELSSQIEITCPDETFFLVDPLDGTKEFIKGLREFTVNIALIHQGIPIYGIIYAPALSKLYVSLDTERAALVKLEPNESLINLNTLNFQDIQVRDWPTQNPVSVESRSHPDEKTLALLERMGIADRIVAGSSLKFCEVAQGSADLYARFGPTMEWDIAAGDAILRAAGGIVLDENANAMTYGKFNSQFRNGAFTACALTSTSRINHHILNK